MDIKKEDPSKVIIVPRPPRSANPELIPIDPVDAAEIEEAEVEEVETEQPESPALTDPGFGPLHNQVDGPALGLAGAPKPEV